jgi:hypothetical protein
MSQDLLLLTPQRAAERLDLGRTKVYQLMASDQTRAARSVMLGASRQRHYRTM